MKLAVVLAVLAPAFALPCAAQDTAPRYAFALSVMEGGVEIASARTVIAVGGQAEVLLTGADGQYTSAPISSLNRATAGTVV